MFVNLANEEDRDREIGKKTLRALIITKPSCNFTLPVVLALVSNTNPRLYEAFELSGANKVYIGRIELIIGTDSLWVR